MPNEKYAFCVRNLTLTNTHYIQVKALLDLSLIKVLVHDFYLLLKEITSLTKNPEIFERLPGSGVNYLHSELKAVINHKAHDDFKSVKRFYIVTVHPLKR